VIPNRHVELPSELSPTEVAAISELINPIHARLLGSVALGVDIWQKSRPSVDQDGHKIDHVHFHILPSNPGTELYGEALNWRRSQFSPLEADERDWILMLLRPEV
jgi:diadenosine tetraphosphate (Ap4A) HIT family hydrolase